MRKRRCYLLAETVTVSLAGIEDLLRETTMADRRVDRWGNPRRAEPGRHASLLRPAVMISYINKLRSRSGKYVKNEVLVNVAWPVSLAS
ncbi:hypothetical protein J6590_055191 [Homalodisca vitripennis]|nr:hypothetical protein J6590_055191 [Homalodisca vitripennis]